MYDEYSMNQALASFEKDIYFTQFDINRKVYELESVNDMIPRKEKSIIASERLLWTCNEVIAKISLCESRTPEQEQDLIELHETFREAELKLQEERKELKEAEESVPIIREELKQLEERLIELNECKRKVLKK